MWYSFFMPNNKNYIKSPVKVSTLIPKILKPTKTKIGSKALELKLNWEKILGKKYSEKCFVLSIKKINKKNVLIVASEENNLLEISYLSEIIKTKINNFFLNYTIHEVKFKRSLQV